MVSQARPTSVRSLLFSGLGVAAAVSGLFITSDSASAEVGFSLFGSGSSVQNVRSDTDELLLPIEVKDWKGSWHAGVGARLSSSTAGRVGGEPRWETRLRLGYGQGSMEDVRVDFTNTSSQTPPYSWKLVESFEYTSVSLNATVLARLHERIGVFIGPGIERVSFTGDFNRAWTGAIPDYCVGTTYCGDRVADAEGTGIYGSLELGVAIPTGTPLSAIELFYVPRRVQMSVTQTVDEDQYKANFADLDASYGIRLTYDF